MAQIIDYDAMRQMIIKSWADLPNPDNDLVTEACKRNAEVFADVGVMVDRERRRADHAPDVTPQFIMALAANTALNIIRDYRAIDESEVSTVDIQHDVVHATLDALSLYLHDAIGFTHNEMAIQHDPQPLPMKDVPDA